MHRKLFPLSTCFAGIFNCFHLRQCLLFVGVEFSSFLSKIVRYVDVRHGEVQFIVLLYLIIICSNSKISAFVRYSMLERYPA